MTRATRLTLAHSRAEAAAAEADLFPDSLPCGRPDRPVKTKGLYAAAPGTGPEGETCGSCKHLTRRKWAKKYLKCELVQARWTRGPGTDVKARSPACAKWEAMLEVAVDAAQSRYDKTRSRKALLRLEDARTAALEAGNNLAREEGRA